MSILPDKPSTQAQLRQTAEERILGGTAPPTRGWTVGAASLTLLHRLASNPTTASDALKLLHELQVHQVELDLQHENMDEAHQALEQTAHRLAELFIFAPIANLMVDSDGHVKEGNFAAAQLLGVERDDLASCNITRLVAPDSRSALLALLKQVLTSGARHSCKVQALDTSRLRYLDVVASSAPGGQHCLVVVVDGSNVHLPSSHA